MSNDIREALEGAFEGEETGNEPVENRQEQATEAPELPENDRVEGENTLTEPVAEEPKPIRDYLRDEKGKFAPKESEIDKNTSKTPEDGVKAGPKVGEPTAVEPQTPPKDPLARAPEAWKPEAREYWKDIPEAAKAEIIRHNQLVYNTLERTAEERRFAQAVNKTLEPYRELIQKEGSDPLKAVGALMETVKTLRTAPNEQKAMMIASVIKQYGVDVQLLDRALIGQPVQENPAIAQMRQQLEQEYAPLKQMKQQWDAVQAQQAEQSQMAARSELDAFYATQPEFLNDVAHDMADIIERFEARGRQFTLEQVYELACREHPEVSRVLSQRDQAKAAQSLTAQAQKARAAAVSVGGAPSMGGEQSAPANSIRDALMYAMSNGER